VNSSPALQTLRAWFYIDLSPPTASLVGLYQVKFIDVASTPPMIIFIEKKS
jgi:hypothetical protein